MSLDLSALTDGELATLSIAGRQAAFAEIMHRYRQPVFRLARACAGDADEALDLTQETFVAAHQALPRYDAARPMRAWLSAMTSQSRRPIANAVGAPVVPEVSWMWWISDSSQHR